MTIHLNWFTFSIAFMVLGSLGIIIGIYIIRKNEDGPPIVYEEEQRIMLSNLHIKALLIMISGIMSFLIGLAFMGGHYLK